MAEEFSYIQPCSPVAIFNDTEDLEEPTEVDSTQTATSSSCTFEIVTEESVSIGKIQQSSSSVAVLNASALEEHDELKHISKF